MMRKRFSGVFKKAPFSCRFDIPSEVREDYLRLYREDYPIDLSPMVLIEIGASSLLGESDVSSPLKRTPAEELSKLEEDVTALREVIREETAAKEELHRSLLTYEEDRTIIGYYYETMDILVKQMWESMRGGT